MTRPSLQARKVGLQIRQRWIVRDVDLAIEPGEVVALVGPNGAGKSTLLRLLAGDLHPTRGAVHLDDRLITEMRPRELALRRAVLPQQTVLQFSFTAREVVEMGRGQRGADHDDAIVTRSLAQTDSLALAGQVYPSLSGGEQARVSLARVLAQETPILLLDEPTASLDLRHQGLVMNLAREVTANGGMVVVVLHDLNVAASFADRVVLMREGLLVADGPPWETLTEPLLTSVFACPLSVTTHPVRGCPLVLPLPI